MEKTLRDELAMSLDASMIPVLENEVTIRLVAKKLGLEVNLKDPLKMIDFAFKYQAIMRYRYADEMLKVRGN